ncbi:MAG: outer membrane protein assembly factor BamC [Gammaproteobacteria bacterium]|nr:outer membrane protein assembly factor BamC [Gammaproteobacteria bacterium]
MRLPLSGLLVVGLVVGAGSGCSWFNDDEGVFVNKSDDYLDAREHPGLVIPDDLNQGRVRDPYPIPPTPQQQNPEYYPQRPPQPNAIYANDTRDEVRIQRLGERRWLALPESPVTVWPKVKQFLAENGVPVAGESGPDGRIDTGWMTITNEAYRDVIRLLLRDGRDEAKVATGRDRLRIRVEQGMRERTAEVHVRHENDSMGLPASDTLVDLNTIESEIADIETDMLNELGAYVAARVSEQTVSMVAQEISSGSKSIITRSDEGAPTLLLFLDRERAWAALGQALNRAEMNVTDQDQTEGSYFVSITEEFLAGEEKKGFFGRMFSFGGGKKKAEDLQIRMERSDARTFSVSVLDNQAQPADRDLSQQLLIMIREFAS